MSLRPRYSLLTLLLLTALVAGGVKLWYGPHHVVERRKSSEEEYSYTPDWHGKRLINGPLVIRYFNEQGSQNAASVMYIRDERQIVTVSLSEKSRHSKSNEQSPKVASYFQLTPAERNELQQAIEREKTRILPQGGEFQEFYSK